MAKATAQMMRLIGPIVIMLGGLAVRGSAQYSLLRPVPSDKLRELTTDRPDKTEGPITVDAGHLQIELDGLTWSIDHPDHGTTVRQWSVVPVNARLGLLDNVDAELIVEPALRNQVRINGVIVQDDGLDVGDVTARVKVNFWGNDGGKTALGVIAFATATPIDGHRVAQGGIILPLSVTLAEGWDLGTMVETDLVADEGVAGRRAVFITSLTVGHALSKHLGIYTEFYSESSRLPWIATADAGLTWSLGANMQLDTGINVGVSHAADDVNPFFGFSVRF